MRLRESGSIVQRRAQWQPPGDFPPPSRPPELPDAPEPEPSPGPSEVPEPEPAQPTPEPPGVPPLRNRLIAACRTVEVLR